jgi:hypothetical protein
MTVMAESVQVEDEDQLGNDGDDEHSISESTDIDSDRHFVGVIT